MPNLNVNLLDRERQAGLAELIRTRSMVGVTTWLLVTLLVTAGGLVGLNLFFQYRLSGQQAELLAVKSTARGGALSLIESTQRFNQQLTVLRPIIADPALDQLLISIAQTLPDGVRLTSLSVEVTGRELVFSAIASTRNDVPELEKSLKAITALSNITLRSNLNERTNVSVGGNATVNLDSFGDV